MADAGQALAQALDPSRIFGLINQIENLKQAPARQELMDLRVQQARNESERLANQQQRHEEIRMELEGSKGSPFYKAFTEGVDLNNYGEAAASFKNFKNAQRMQGMLNQLKTEFGDDVPESMFRQARADLELGDLDSAGRSIDVLIGASDSLARQRRELAELDTADRLDIAKASKQTRLGKLAVGRALDSLVLGDISVTDFGEVLKAHPNVALTADQRNILLSQKTAKSKLILAQDKARQSQDIVRMSDPEVPDSEKDRILFEARQQAEKGDEDDRKHMEKLGTDYNEFKEERARDRDNTNKAYSLLQDSSVSKALSGKLDVADIQKSYTKSTGKPLDADVAEAIAGLNQVLEEDKDLIVATEQMNKTMTDMLAEFGFEGKPSNVLAEAADYTPSRKEKEALSATPLAGFSVQQAIHPEGRDLATAYVSPMRDKVFYFTRKPNGSLSVEQYDMDRSTGMYRPNLKSRQDVDLQSFMKSNVLTREFLQNPRPIAARTADDITDFIKKNVVSRNVESRRDGKSRTSRIVYRDGDGNEVGDPELIKLANRVAALGALRVSEGVVRRRRGQQRDVSLQGGLDVATEAMNIYFDYVTQQAMGQFK